MTGEEIYDDQYSGQKRNRLGHFQTKKTEVYPMAPHKIARRNPNLKSGTSKDAIRVRETMNWKEWDAGVWKFLEIIAKSGKAEESQLYGIEGELLTNPDITVIQTADLPEEAVEKVLAICNEHDAVWVRMCSNKTSKRCRNHGYLRQKAVIQRFTQRLGLKTVLIVVVQAVGEILKPSKDEYGRLLKSIMRRIAILSNKIGRMEKTEGSRYLKEYLARSRKGSEAYKIMEEERISQITEGVRAGDSKAAFDLVVPK